jgi:predicted dehydrogenase
MDKEIPSEVEDNSVINLDFGNGTFGVITANYCTQTQYGPSLEIYGSKGAIFVENGYLKFTTSQIDLQGLFISKTPLEFTFPNEPIVERFIDYLTQDKDFTPYGEQQVHVIEILEKAIQSSNEGRVVKLTTTFDHKLL